MSISFPLRASSAILALTIASRVIAGDIVVVMGPSATAMTRDQIANIYLGRSTVLKPVDLPESSAVRAAFYKKVTNRDADQIKTVWSRLTFTGQGQPPKVLPDAAAIKKVLAADPKAIGYIEKSEVDATVKIVLTVD
ncbi:MAG: hypothetical protein ABJD53_01250 [Gammaproteobacteria bacterium]